MQRRSEQYADLQNSFYESPYASTYDVHPQDSVSNAGHFQESYHRYSTQKLSDDHYDTPYLEETPYHHQPSHPYSHEHGSDESTLLQEPLDKKMDTGSSAHLVSPPDPSLSQKELPHYPPANEAGSPQDNHQRPNVFMRMLYDRTPVDIKKRNRQKGIGVQRFPIVCYLLALIMFCVFINELVVNKKYTGQLIAIKPNFNPMIGPTSEVLINVGARFTPCIRSVPEVAAMNFPCLDDPSGTASQTCKLEDICGFGGFGPSGVPDQSFRLFIPIFLHAGLIHILLNCAALLTLSALIEKLMGSIRFIVMFIPAGIFGFILGANFSLVGLPSVGASGAIFGTYAAVLVDLLSHWQIEAQRKRKLGMLCVEIIIGLGLGLIPGIDNFSHIGGFAMGILFAILLVPSIHETKRHRLITYGLRIGAFIGIIVLFVVLTKNIYSSDPNSACIWCRYLSCWPTASNNHCKGTGLTTTSTSMTLVVTLRLLASYTTARMFAAPRISTARKNA